MSSKVTGLVIGVVAVLFFSTLSLAQPSEERYVARCKYLSGSETMDNPFRTLTEAIEDIDALGRLSQSTIFVRGGSYPESLVIENRVTIRG